MVSWQLRSQLIFHLEFNVADNNIFILLLALIFFENTFSMFIVSFLLL